MTAFYCMVIKKGRVSECRIVHLPTDNDVSYSTVLQEVLASAACLRQCMLRELLASMQAA